MLRLWSVEYSPYYRVTMLSYVFRCERYWFALVQCNLNSHSLIFSLLPISAIIVTLVYKTYILYLFLNNSYFIHLFKYNLSICVLSDFLTLYCAWRHGFGNKKNEACFLIFLSSEIILLNKFRGSLEEVPLGEERKAQFS